MDAYVIIVVAAIIPGVAVALLRKRQNWPSSVHWIIPLGLPFLVAVAITINSIYASRDDSQFAFGIAALILLFFPFAALYGVTAWVTEKILVSKKHPK